MSQGSLQFRPSKVLDQVIKTEEFTDDWKLVSQDLEKVKEQKNGSSWRCTRKNRCCVVCNWKGTRYSMVVHLSGLRCSDGIYLSNSRSVTYCDKECIQGDLLRVREAAGRYAERSALVTEKSDRHPIS